MHTRNLTDDLDRHPRQNHGTIVAGRLGGFALVVQPRTRIAVDGPRSARRGRADHRPAGPTRHGIRLGGAAAAPRVAGDWPSTSSPIGGHPSLEADLDAASTGLPSGRLLSQDAPTAVLDGSPTILAARLQPAVLGGCDCPPAFTVPQVRRIVPLLSRPPGVRVDGRAAHDASWTSSATWDGHAGGGPGAGKGLAERAREEGRLQPHPRKWAAPPRPGASSSGDPAPARPD